MKIFGYEFKTSKAKQEVLKEPNAITTESSPESLLPYGGQKGGGWYGGGFTPVIVNYWNGEKTPGELGAIPKMIPMHRELRLRAYAAFATTDIIKTLASKRFQWVIGDGLKLQSEPNKTVLEMEGVSVPDNFIQKVEARWGIYSNSIYSDYEKKKSLHAKAMDFYSDKFKGGDCLCVCRIEDTGPTVQFISGEFVCNPGLNIGDNKKGEGNYIENGVEFNSRGEDVAYWVHIRDSENPLGKFDRILAYGEGTKRRLAWMIYGQRISPDHKRGVPEFAQILEKVVKLDRYVDASVGKAEQAANILFTIEHNEISDGSNPIVKDIIQRNLKTTTVDNIDGYAIGDGLANKITQTTSNQVFNLPRGAKFNSFGTDIETGFSEFYNSNFNSIAAAVDTPPEVALQMYNSNYSASRAAINGWGYVVDLDRKDFASQFYKPFYALWLEFEILTGKIDAPGFILAIATNNFMIKESYTQSRWIGKNMPHIDPVKEINAIREALGNMAEGKAPLISYEQAVEALNYGNWSENYAKYKEEDKTIEKPIENATIDTTKESGSGLAAN